MNAPPTVVITRPREQAQAWVDALTREGFAAAAVPLLGIAPAPDPAPVERIWADLSAWDLLVFVSPSAVAHFFALRPAAAPGGCHPRWPERPRVAAPGPGTLRGVQAQGVPSSCCIGPDADAEQFDSESLWRRLGQDDWRGRRVLLVRGDGGREWLGERLREAGADVQAVQAYARGAPQWTPQEALDAGRALSEPEGHAWLFSSSEALTHLPGLAAALDAGLPPWAALAPALRAWATHPRIAEAAAHLGLRRVEVIRPGTADLLQHLRSRAEPERESASD